MEDSLEKRLVIKFERQLTIREIKSLILHITRYLPFHARINYNIITREHAGTTYREVSKEAFKTKTDCVEIEGTVVSGTCAQFTIPCYSESLERPKSFVYTKMQFKPPMKVEFPAPGWPKIYYDLINHIRKPIKSYFSKNKACQ